MKKIFIGLLLTISATAFAHGPHGHWRHGGDSRWFWMTPMIVGGAVAYEVSRPPVIVQQPVVVQQNQVYTDSACSPWTQIQNPDGTITSTRTCR